MNRGLMFTLAVVTLLPLASLAQEPAVAYGEWVRPEAPESRPLAPWESGLSADSSWFTNVMSGSSQLPVGSPAEAALNAGVNSGVAAELPPPDDAAGAGQPFGQVFAEEKRWPPPGVFARHAWEAEYLTGFFRNPIFVESRRTGYLLPEIVRLGWMRGEPNLDRRFRGNLEGLVELDCMPITSGAGNIVIGASALARYNFAFRDRRFITYLQGGGGGVYCDSYLFPFSPVGTGFNFIINFAAGAHYFLNRHWALTSELDYYHLSNAGISKGNFGFNMLGFTFGFSYFFGK